ncbi:hypothetical protein PENPOL_c005G09949 [Penicillium polonicum]|uniref:Uncharacterized protein n=1 Tax=Penicillium polonicum TaxID=60169 RepID=A0A1V6NMR2_PENPO|nr:hypothetical protein PENPOL_c005G09949 [Penicillium polonicum]
MNNHDGEWHQIYPLLLDISSSICSCSLTTSETTKAAVCSPRSVKTIRSNLRRFGNTRAPSYLSSRPRSTTSLMLEILCDRWLEMRGLCPDEMAGFFLREFGAQVTISSVRRALAAKSSPRTPLYRKRRNKTLTNRSEFRSYHLVYIDESGWQAGGLQENRLVTAGSFASLGLQTSSRSTVPNVFRRKV